MTLLNIQRCALLLITLLLSSCVLAQYSLVVRVVGEDGEPIEGANVVAGFAGSGNTSSRRGQTNAEGLVTLRGHSGWSVRYRVEKEGYYQSNRVLGFGAERRYEDEIVLREVIEPIPGYFNRVVVPLPEQGVFYGFDLLEGDLVEVGDGVVADFYASVEFELLDEEELYFHQVLTVRSAGAGSGFQLADLPQEWVHSDFKSHHQAPEDGYIDSVRLEVRRTEEGTDRERMRRESWALKPLYFRSRVNLNDDGGIEQAMYCKFFGNYPERGLNQFGGIAYDRGLGFTLTYECNPNLDPMDRNVEFDRTRNLF